MVSSLLGLVIDGGAHWIRPLRMLAPGDIDSVSATLGATQGMESMDGRCHDALLLAAFVVQNLIAPHTHTRL